MPSVSVSEGSMAGWPMKLLLFGGVVLFGRAVLPRCGSLEREGRSVGWWKRKR